MGEKKTVFEAFQTMTVEEIAEVLDKVLRYAKPVSAKGWVNLLNWDVERAVKLTERSVVNPETPEEAQAESTKEE